MPQDRLRPDSGRLVIARLDGVAQRHARWREPTEAETDAAVAELREVVTRRDDAPALLAEVAGTLTGFHEGGLNEARARAGAHFCIAAGEEEGRRWAEAARRMP